MYDLLSFIEEANRIATKNYCDHEHIEIVNNDNSCGYVKAVAECFTSEKVFVRFCEFELENQKVSGLIVYDDGKIESIFTDPSDFVAAVFS